MIRAAILGIALACISAAQQRISIPAKEGGVIYADQYGRGNRAVVLAHGGRFDRKSWSRQAQALAAAGFRAFTIDYRGEGQASDILAAVHYLRRTGSKSVSVV